MQHNNYVTIGFSKETHRMLVGTKRSRNLHSVEDAVLELLEKSKERDGH
jgi:hypothetical protein